MAGAKKLPMDYFARGQEAYRENKPIEANPYRFNEHAEAAYADYWDQGWQSEFRASEGHD